MSPLAGLLYGNGKFVSTLALTLALSRRERVNVFPLWENFETVG